MVDAAEGQHSLTIRRTIRAPRETVFDAWTQPTHLKNWWRAKTDWTTEIAEVDFQVGGHYRLGMRDPAQEGPFVCHGRFVEIDRPQRVVYTWAWEPPAEDVGETLVTVEFLERGDSTELVLTHTRFPNADAAVKHNGGWSGCLDNFESLLQQP